MLPWLAILWWGGYAAGERAGFQLVGAIVLTVAAVGCVVYVAATRTRYADRRHS